MDGVRRDVTFHVGIHTVLVCMCLGYETHHREDDNLHFEKKKRNKCGVFVLYTYSTEYRVILDRDTSKIILCIARSGDNIV